jgi:hypothetical protein
MTFLRPFLCAVLALALVLFVYGCVYAAAYCVLDILQTVT